VSEAAIFAAGALTPTRALARVRVVARGGRIASLEANARPRRGDAVFADAMLVPGLVDLQVNGALGAAYDDPSAEARRRATDFHVRSGTTSLLGTLVSAPLEPLAEALARLAGDVDARGPVVGIHLEGPFLAPEKRGAHAESALVEPTRASVARLLSAAGPSLSMLTLAPELPGALECVERAARAGIAVAAGHSRATLACVRAAIERGLSFVTHVGNASDWPQRAFDPARGFRTSEPGLVGAFLVEPRLSGSLILDGVHLHPELARALVKLRGPDHVALVSDATPATGLAPGRYRIGGLDAELRRDRIAVAGEGLAGSAVPLVDCVRCAVRDAGLPLATAIRMATATPARVAGVQRRKGRLARGADADLLLLGPDLELRAVYRRGEPVPRA
jgi:N-acetylglucosamine-6-phosphate deacetylase